MLSLILTHWNKICLVQENVGGHQHRVSEEPDHRAVGTRLLRLVLELRHPTGLAESGHAFHHPTKLVVLGYVRLQEEITLFWINTHGEKLRGGCQTPSPEDFWFGFYR